MLGIAPTNNIDVAYFFSINEKTKLALSDRFKANKENALPQSVTLDLQSDDILEAYRILTEKGVFVEKLENPVESYYEFYFTDLDNNHIRMHGFVE
ncbi:VOC family protein [Psychrobacillus sp. NPDC058041]|uniref:VOC family protein n=1 Tax=Psychrobacillus sp. NPDC058041 TaxID=3346310 RepID=UPI0036DF068D